MTKSLQEFIRERRPEITAQIHALREELKQLDVAEIALSDKRPQTTHKPTDLPTIKEMVLEVLAGYPQGIRANEILSAIESRHGARIARESLSPQLSRLKDEGKIILKGRKWCLIQEINPRIAIASEGL